MLEVLLVDDEPSVIQLLQELIDWNALGYKICGTASNGEEALEILKNTNPHLAIIDIRMPKMDGLQLLEQASGILYLRTKFIILSAYNDFKYAKTAMRYGVSDYILKPIDDEEVNPALKRVSEQIYNEIGTREAEANKLKFVASNYINRIIKDESDEELQERCKRILELSDDTPFRCVLVEINDFENLLSHVQDRELQNKRLSVRKAIETAVGEENMLTIFDDEIQRFGIILTGDRAVNENQYLKELKMLVQNNSECDVAVSLSERTTGIVNLGNMYRQAAIALQYRFFQMEDSLLYYEQFKNVPLNYNFYKSNPEALLEDIKANNISGIKDKINDVFGEFYKEKCAPEVIVNYIKNIEFDIVKHVLDHKGNVDELITRLENFSKTVGRTPINILTAEFYNITLYISDYYKSISSRSSKDVIIEIKNFIHQNYQKNLKLQQVAKIYYINSVYLGQVFAKTTGMHFNEYLHHVRIEEAKKLLKRTDLKISAISSMVGYCDSEHFVSKFKALTQHVPSDYRKKQCCDN